MAAARDLAVLLLLYGAGLRVGETVGLTGVVLPLGQASLSSTQIYTVVDATHLRDVYRNAHPRA